MQSFVPGVSAPSIKKSDWMSNASSGLCFNIHLYFIKPKVNIQSPIPIFYFLALILFACIVNVGGRGGGGGGGGNCVYIATDLFAPVLNNASTECYLMH